LSTERVLAIAVFAGSILLLFRLGPSAVRSWQIYAGTGRRRQQDATGRAPVVPSSVADRTQLLADLGYRRLGETRLHLPVGERFAWIVVADDGESYAILVDAPQIGGLTGVYSAWPDGTWLCTIHPRGQAVDRSSLAVRIVASTLDQAVRVHRAGLERFRPIHGAPRAIRTMPDMLALDADYRTRFGGSRLWPVTARIVIPALVVALLAVLSLALVISAR